MSDILTIGAIALAVVGVAIYLKSKKKKKAKKKDRVVITPTPRPTPAPDPTPLPTPVPEPTPVIIPPIEEDKDVADLIREVITDQDHPDYVVTDEEAEETLRYDEEVAAKEPVGAEPPKPAPKKGPFRKPVDHAALWNFKVARATKNIDLSKFGAPVRIRKGATMENRKYDFNVIEMPNKNFVGQLRINSRIGKGVIYLCDSTGKVYDFAISAEGARSSGPLGNQKEIVYVKDTFDGNPYVVQVSNGSECPAIYFDERVLGATRGKKGWVMNDKIAT